MAKRTGLTKLGKLSQTHKPIFVIVLFSLIALATLFITRAAIPAASIEPELGNVIGNATTVNNVGGASGGSGIKFGSQAPTAAPLCSDATSWNTASNWSSGSVPQPGQDATIAANKKVVMDSNAYANSRLRSLTIPSTSQLCFNDSPTKFRVGFIINYGTIQVGKENQPITSKVEIILDVLQTDPANTFPLTELNDNTGGTFGAGNGGLYTMRNARFEAHGRKVDTTWTKLAQTAQKGATSITLQDSINGQWSTGDKIVLAPSGLKPLEFDEATIASISNDGKTIQLTTPLQFQHLSVSTTMQMGNETRTIEERSEVGLLSHNLVIRGPDNAESTQYGGHLMGFYQAKQRITGVELRNMGQLGVLGRYPLHFHHTINAQDSLVKGNSIVRSFNRVLAIHNTNNLTFTNNVGHDTFGHAIMQENGTETGGVITKNLVMTVRRAPDGKRLLSPSSGGVPRIGPGFGNSDDTPSAYWLTNPANTFTDNVAAGCEGTGIWMDFGPDPSTSDNLNASGARTQRITAFDRNVSHSNQDSPQHNGGQHRFQAVNGIFIGGYIGNGSRPSIINDNVVWKNWDIGIWVDGSVISYGAKGANNGVASLNGYASFQKSTFIMHSAATNFSDASSTGETGHFSSLVRWYAVGSEYDDTWLGNFAPSFSTSNRTGVAAIEGGHFEYQEETPRMRNTKFFNEVSSGTNKSRRVYFPGHYDGWQVHFMDDSDGTVVGNNQPSYISDSSKQGSLTSSAHLYPGDTVDGRSWARYLTGNQVSYMSIHGIGPSGSGWRVTRDSDGGTLNLDSGSHRHSLLKGQRYRYYKADGSALTSFNIYDAYTDRPGFTEIWIDWAPSTAPKVTKQEYFATQQINATQATSLADLATGKEYYWDQANKRVYLRINGGGQIPPYSTPNGMGPDGNKIYSEWQIRQ